MKIEKTNWCNIESNFENGSLIIGNGTSIAIHHSFDYTGLYEESIKQKLISKEVSDIFTLFSTKNFEVILKHLGRAASITELLGEVKTNQTISQKYNEVREALYQIVHRIHPPIISEESFNTFFSKKNLEKKVLFLEKFRTIICLNYDLILYWIMNWSRLTYKTRKDNNEMDAFKVIFKDCFIKCDEKMIFHPDYKILYDSIDERKVSLVFYPHGNIILANDLQDDIPIKILDSSNLLETINSKWASKVFSPLIVCEGETKSKIEAIESNPYTNLVFHAVLPNLHRENKNITILGWSLDKSDQHILRQILRNKPESLAISYYSSANESYLMNRIESTWKGLFTNKETRKLSVNFPIVYLFPARDVW